MMREKSADNFRLQGWLNWEINDSQGFGGCGRDGHWVEMNSSCDPIDLLPVDPFEMNVGTTLSEIDVGERISAAIAGFIGRRTNNYEVGVNDLIVGSNYYWGKPLLSSFETQVNSGSSAIDFCNVGFFGSDLDVIGDENFGDFRAMEEVLVSVIDDLAAGSNYNWGKPLLSSIETHVNSGSSAVDFCNVGFSDSDLDVTGAESFWASAAMDEVLVLGRGFSQSILNGTGDESFGAFGDMEEVLVSGRRFSRPNFGVIGDRKFGAMKEVLVSDRDFSGSVLNVTGNGSFVAFGPMEEVLVSGRGEVIQAGGDVNWLHEGLLLSLGYLAAQELLSVERVCRSLRSAVQNDPLLWRCIHIDSPLGEKITDDALYKLIQRAQGSLRCLSLVQCSKITDDGLKRVMDSNLMLKKLNVSGCVRLTAEGLINNLKTLKLSGMPGIKNLKLGRHFIGSAKDFEELSLLVGADEPHRIKARKLQFFHDGISSLVCDDDIAIDIEICPGCNKSRLLFDCPSESCRSKGPDHCRACSACIERCIECGKCVEKCKYMETFFLNSICSGCANHSSESEDIQEEK